MAFDSGWSNLGKRFIVARVKKVDDLRSFKKSFYALVRRFSKVHRTKAEILKTLNFNHVWAGLYFSDISIAGIWTECHAHLAYKHYVYEFPDARCSRENKRNMNHII